MAAAKKSSLFPPDPYYIPGYEGFVPQYGYQFGETFGKTTFRLFIQDFSGTKHEVPDYIPAHPEIKQPVKIEGVTLPAVTETVDAESYNRLPKLDVPNAIQQKAISGYTGYIPRYTWITGVNYIQAVKDAMNEFDRNQFLQRNTVCDFGKRLPQTYWPNKRIYTSAGLIPFYTGFVPTLRHSYALTFGNSTRKAYQKEQRRQACALRKKL
nr:PREDICTED: protein FAM166A [Struthio camelus australis]